ncbi:MAG TPA: lipid-A-disaccharide synthase [Blastocatellia bacterium]|nr:lipid-A-disaccharide synthase [Blastocatellia bacterium]
MTMVEKEKRKKDSALRIMVVAGEASGDKHGAALVCALRKIYPNAGFEIFGSGGEEMRSAGVETLVDARETAVIGVPEIARAIGRLYSAYRTLLEAARARRPDTVVLIDWPDFNMRLARRLRREGHKIVYYISPQVWAWRRYRVRALRRDVERMLVILPFEEEFYKGEGIEVEYVGHPLTDAVRATATRDEFARRHGLDPSRTIIALLPGSRHKEIHYHLPAMLDAARRLSRSLHSDAQFVVPLASTVNREQVEAIMSEAGSDRTRDVTVIERDTYDALGHAEIAVVASGTATVEAALIGTPMVIVYRASELNWRLIRPLIHLDTFGMVNLIAGCRVVPELIQHDVTGEKIASEVTRLLSDPARLARMREDLGEVRDRLKAAGGSGAERAARAVMEVAAKNEGAENRA